VSVKHIIQLNLVFVLLFASFAFISNAYARSYCGSTYVVQPGDRLVDIARHCRVSLIQLYTVNPGVDSHIFPGQVVYITSENGSGHDYGNYFCGPSYSEYYGNYYVVCRGDTLSSIARYYGVSMSYLQWRNGVPNANRIYAGQFIYP